MKQPRLIQAQQLERHLTVSVKIECHLCGEQADAGEVCLPDLPEIVLRLYRDGWRQRTSRRYQVTCAMCPDCARAKDSKR